MLSCHEVNQKSGALLDGELSWSERMQMRIHLAMCRHCSRFVAQLRLLRGALRQRGGQSARPLPEAQVDKIVDSLPLPPSGARQD